MNGSFDTGHCTNVTTSTDGGSTCNTPNTSVLFDGNIPTLTGLQGDMWASQLLILQSSALQVNISFNFTSTDSENPPIMELIEVVMFNCPELGTEVQTIQHLGFNHFILGYFL